MTDSNGEKMRQDDRHIATVRTYDELVMALRARADELGLAIGSRGSANGAHQSIDEIAGLPDGYIGKALSPGPRKALGHYSMGPVLTILGVKLAILEDADALKTMASRMPKRLDGKNARDAMHAARNRAKRIYLTSRRGNSQWGSTMQARWMLKTTPRQRRQIAKQAARARWQQSEQNANA